MKVILLHDVRGMGKKYEIKEVSQGHALNMLIPRGLAKIATPDAIKKMEVERSREMEKIKVHEDLILKNLNALSGTLVTIREKANPKGQLFAGIHQNEIASIVKRETQLDLDPTWIELPKPIKSVGSHAINVKVKDKKASFTLVVEAL